MDEVDDLEARECPKCHGLMVKQEIDETCIVKIASVGSDSEMRRICDQILLRMKDGV